MKRKLLLTLVTIAFLAFFCTPPGQAASKPEFTMKFQTAWPAAFGLNALAKRLAKQIEFESNGRIEVKFYTAGQIVPGMEVWDATSMGVIDAAHVCTCYTVGKTWAGGFLCNGPSMPPPALKALWMFEGGGNEVAQKIFDKYFDVKLIPALVMTEAWAYSNAEINSLEDLKKLKFRASGVRATTLNNLGMSVVSLPGGELIPAMQKGVIDAFEFSSLGCDQTFGADEVVKYVYYSHYVDGGTPFLVINKKWWKKIGPDLQKAIERAAYDTTLWTFGYLSLLELKAFHTSETKNHTEIRWLPPDVEKALITSAQEIIAEKRKTDKEMDMIMDSLEAFMAKYGKFSQFNSNMY